MDFNAAYKEAEQKSAKRAPLKVVTAAERVAPTESNFLIKGVIRRTAVGVLFGTPGAGKSTIAADIACHVATGKKWRMLKTNPGPW